MRNIKIIPMFSVENAASPGSSQRRLFDATVETSDRLDKTKILQFTIGIMSDAVHGESSKFPYIQVGDVLAAEFDYVNGAEALEFGDVLIDDVLMVLLEESSFEY